jgi:mannosyltransferase
MQPDPTGFASPFSTSAPIAIEFDDIIFALQRFGGISEYWREMTSRVAAMGRFAVSRSTGGRWARLHSPGSRAEVFHSSYFRTARGARVRNVTTVHDMVYEMGLAGTGLRAAWHRHAHRRALFSSDAIVCVSARTRDDLLEVYPSLATRCPIAVIHHGVAALDVTHVDRDRHGQPYLLFVGGRGTYKNFGVALQAFAASGLWREGFQLHCTGHPFTHEEVGDIARRGLAAHVIGLGALPRAELDRLYAGAYCLLYPSLFEGFGMPLLEAMRAGCPVVAANRSVMPEIAGDAALLVDAEDPHAVATALLRLSDPALRRSLAASGRARATLFTWARSASQHAEVYLALVAADHAPTIGESIATSADAQRTET